MLGQVDITRRYASVDRRRFSAIDRMLPIIITGDCAHKSPLGIYLMKYYSPLPPTVNAFIAIYFPRTTIILATIINNYCNWKKLTVNFVINFSQYKNPNAKSCMSA